MTAAYPTDHELIETMLEKFHDLLTEKQVEAFSGMRSRSTELTENQSKWVRGV